MRTRIKRGPAAFGTAENDERPSRGFDRTRRRSGSSFSSNGREDAYDERRPSGPRERRNSNFGNERRGSSYGNQSRSFSRRENSGDSSENRFGRRDGERRTDRFGGRNAERYGNRTEKRPYGNTSGKKYDSREGAERKNFGKSYNRKYTAKPAAPVAEDFNEEDTFDKSLIRLNKFIANSGVCSRREADEYIKAGLVTVNGEVIDQVGVRIHASDDVRFNGQRLKGEKKVYVLMNKPKDYVTTTSDPHAEKNVLDLIDKDMCPERIFPVGRLDKATTGVLLLTNDGDLTEKLTHPSYNRKKIYQVSLDKNLKKPDFTALLEGFELEDGFIAADALSYLDGKDSELGIEIHSGRNRIIRRMFEHLGYTVKKLDRVYFAGLTKKNLRRGQWRFLTNQEVAMLKMGSYE